jgi:hypothetical protein
MKVLIKLLLATLSLIGCSSITPTVPAKKYFSGTVSIAKGNTWVYLHHYNTDRGLIKYINSVITMAIDSVLISQSGDSTKFRMTTIDSGTADTAVFVYRDTNNYLLTKGTIFAMDSSGSWKQDTGAFLSFAEQPDSIANYTRPSGVQTCHLFARSTSCDTVTVNGTTRGDLFTTLTSREACWGMNNLGYFRGLDSLQWLDNIGLSYRSYHSTNQMAPADTAENYSLFSFNDSPATISY